MLFGLSALVAFIAKKQLKMSPIWYISAFIPLVLLKINDIKHFPYSEVENFYRYALEVKSAKQRYSNDREVIVGDLKKYDNEKFDQIQNQLKKSQISLIEAVNHLDNQYLEI